MAYNELSEGGEEFVDPKIVQLLAVPVAKLTKLLILNSHQKLDEVIFAGENNLKVNPHQHGPDMFDTNNNPIELKVSVITQSNKNTAHFNWPVPQKGKSEADRRKALLESIINKTKNGSVIMIVKNGRSKEVTRFTLSHQFLYDYFTRVKIGTSDKHLMSAAQCNKCKQFHRFAKYQEASDTLKKGRKVDWNQVMSKTYAQCK